MGDVVDPEGKFLTMDDIKRKFDISINFLHYYMVKKIVAEFINHHKLMKNLKYIDHTYHFISNLLQSNFNKKYLFGHF